MIEFKIEEGFIIEAKRRLERKKRCLLLDHDPGVEQIREFKLEIE
jgi:hypothetical protein